MTTGVRERRAFEQIGGRMGRTMWAWTRPTAGRGAGHGVGTAVAYGVMALVASLPGALVLVGASIPRAGPRQRPESTLGSEVAVVVRTDGRADA